MKEQCDCSWKARLQCRAILRASVFFLVLLNMAVSELKAAVSELDILKDQDVSIADLHEVPITEASGNVYVITDEDIRHSGATDIASVLRRIPGMEVMQMTQADFNLSVRGNNQTTANRILVLVDGRSIYEDTFGSVFWTLLPVTLPEIKRIEVLKGPASSIYGFNAFDGVINIITKSPGEMKGNTNGTTVQVGGGEFGTLTAAAVQAGTYDKFGYRLSVGHDQAQKWSDRDALALRSNKFNLHTDYALSPLSKLVVSGGLVDSNRFDGQVFGLIRESSSIANGYAKVAYERPNTFLRASWIRWEETRLELLDPRVSPFLLVTDRDGNIQQNYRQDVYNFEGQHASQIATNNRLTYGFNYRHNAVSLNFLDKFTRENRFGLFIQDEWKASDWLTVVTGLRNDLHTEINPTYSPRLSLIFKPVQDHTIRVSGSVAYRPPNNLETHTDQRTFFLPFVTVPCGPGSICLVVRGSPNLEAEKIVSYEAGYQGWFLKHRLRLRGDLFYNHISDFITLVATADPSVITFGNVGKADIYGGEAGAEFLATSWLTGFANYSFVNLWQSSDLQNSGAARGAPAYKINAGLRGEWLNGLNGEVAVHHVAAASFADAAGFAALAPFFGFTPPEARVGSYTLLNFRVAYQFIHEKAEVGVSVFNALNDHHRENPVGDPISSRVMGWLTIRL